jgi:hypothetical protein
LVRREHHDGNQEEKALTSPHDVVSPQASIGITRDALGSYRLDRNGKSTP